jgi:hypothetical protein
VTGVLQVERIRGEANPGFSHRRVERTGTGGDRHKLKAQGRFVYYLVILSHQVCISSLPIVTLRVNHSGVRGRNLSEARQSMAVVSGID